MGGFVFSIMFAFVMWMAAIAMAIMAVIAICALMNYIFESIFLYRVSQIRNYSHGFLAWIPFLNKLRLGQIAGKKNVGISSALPVLQKCVLVRSPWQIPV